MSSQTLWPIKIKTVALFYPIMAAQNSDFFCSLYYALDISSPKIKLLR